MFPDRLLVVFLVLTVDKSLKICADFLFRL